MQPSLKGCEGFCTVAGWLRFSLVTVWALNGSSASACRFGQLLWGNFLHFRSGRAGKIWPKMTRFGLYAGHFCPFIIPKLMFKSLCKFSFPSSALTKYSTIQISVPEKKGSSGSGIAFASCKKGSDGLMLGHADQILRYARSRESYRKIASERYRRDSNH